MNHWINGSLTAVSTCSNWPQQMNPQEDGSACSMHFLLRETTSANLKHEQWQLFDKLVLSGCHC